MASVGLVKSWNNLQGCSIPIPLYRVPYIPACPWRNHLPHFGHFSIRTAFPTKENHKTVCWRADALEWIMKFTSVCYFKLKSISNVIMPIISSGLCSLLSTFISIILVLKPPFMKASFPIKKKKLKVCHIAEWSSTDSNLCIYLRLILKILS